jgi:hypothetical protein
VVLAEIELEGAPEIFGIEMAVEFAGNVIGATDGVVVGVGKG